ncbi:pirin family protein [Shewanella sp. OMA3-2]|uniref:pirin family protein n=1 Tax=Shewanella sp. OMA3-2 TaxID=2908650 RepID=UPI001F1583ED|nr:pirin family protein [Shewanella sp. OMA3-2]UJF21650.1 pirin family protein [Shewanella sp. OMA3-2]
MQIINKTQARPAMDGDGVNIKRVADFGKQSFDPYLMLDELKSDDKQDFIGGFPPHPHRGIETFTYIMKGGFEHRDHMGNVKAIRAGDVQWMSTGSGVIHSEMPSADANEGLHGFQIWLNMPAKDKMRPAIYRDTTVNPNPSLLNGKGAKLIALAGTWQFADVPNSITNTHIEGLAGSGAIADMIIEPNSSANILLNQYGAVNVYIYQGLLNVKVDGDNVVFGEGTMLKLNPQILAQFNAGDSGLGCLILAGNPINEQIVHMGPFVMNTQAEINQAVEDYQQGRFGHLAD